MARNDIGRRTVVSGDPRKRSSVFVPVAYHARLADQSGAAAVSL